MNNAKRYIIPPKIIYFIFLLKVYMTTHTYIHISFKKAVPKPQLLISAKNLSKGKSSE